MGPTIRLFTSLNMNVLRREHIRKGQAIRDPPYAVAIGEYLYHLEAAAQVPEVSVAYTDRCAHAQRGI